jgi:hypothetical protein
MNEIYHCPFMKARIFLGGKNQENNLNNNNFNNKKIFIEKPGDWICNNCQNLNFSFRTNCNRCHMPKSENQKLNQNFQMNGYINNMNFY